MDKQLEKHMFEAIGRAVTVKGGTYPNPPVGAVLVQGGSIIAAGVTAEAGGPHAEVDCIENAGAEAAGGDLFVTLEPCSHHGKTPPCTDRIIRAGISRVYIACTDPNPLVNGKGIELLRQAGIEVHTGLLERTAAMLLYRPFFHYIQTGMPYVILKYAMTLDGKIACSGGDANWISGQEASEHVHILRKECNGILVGANTVRQDNPTLDCRIQGIPERFQPARIVVTGNGIDTQGKKIARDDGRFIQALSGSGDVAGRSVRFDGSIRDLLHKLAKEGVVSLLVEGGRDILTGFIKESCVQEFHTIIAPAIAGGDYSPVGELGITQMKKALRLEGVWKPLGKDILFIGDTGD